MKERIFIDTNIVIDLLGERIPFYTPAARIFTLADKGKIQIIVSALTYSTVFYVLSRFEEKETVKEKLKKFKILVETAELNEKIIDQGLSSRFIDFEDAIQYYCAINRDCTTIITRNGKDFKASAIPVLTPDEYLSRLKNR
ncbi:MAG: PIN domain-containing protein [Bacteroidota bacterium]